MYVYVHICVPMCVCVHVCVRVRVCVTLKGQACVGSKRNCDIKIRNATTCTVTVRCTTSVVISIEMIAWFACNCGY